MYLVLSISQQKSVFFIFDHEDHDFLLLVTSEGIVHRFHYDLLIAFFVCTRPEAAVVYYGDLYRKKVWLNFLSFNIQITIKFVFKICNMILSKLDLRHYICLYTLTYSPKIHFIFIILLFNVASDDDSTSIW